MGYRRSWGKTHGPYWSLHVACMPPKPLGPDGILPPARTVEEDVRSLDEASHGRRRSPQHAENLREERRQQRRKTGKWTHQRRRFA
jgi:hypothetical protein